jgi:hypothetical protein
MGGMPGQKFFTFGIGGGISVPVNDAKDAFKQGFNGMAYVRIQPSFLPFSFGVNVAFQQFDFKDATLSTGGPTTSLPNGSSQVLAGLGQVKFNLMRGPIYPYITAGLGAYNFSSDAENSQSKTQFGINGGAGLAMHVGKIAAYLEGRVDNVYTSDKGVIEANSIQVVPVSLGVEF